MNIYGAAGFSPSSSNSRGDSFAESLRKEGSASTRPHLTPSSAQSVQAGGVDTGLVSMSSDVIQVPGESRLDAPAFSQEANDEMRRCEEKANKC